MLGTPGHRALHRPDRRAAPRLRWWLPVALVPLVAATGGVADAYWTGTGGAAGSGVTGTSASLVVTPGTPSAQLRPGGTSNVVLTITNPNEESVSVASLTLDATRAAAGLSVDAAHADCDTGALTYTADSTGWTVPGRTGSVDGSLAVVLVDAMAMSADAADSCQGAQFGVHLEGMS
jgi:hypothetical protein